MNLNERFKNRIEQYEIDFRKYGYDPKSLAMPSDRRSIRYHELIKHFTFFKK